MRPLYTDLPAEGLNKLTLMQLAQRSSGKIDEWSRYALGLDAYYMAYPTAWYK